MWVGTTSPSIAVLELIWFSVCLSVSAYDVGVDDERVTTERTVCKNSVVAKRCGVSTECRILFRPQ